MNRIASFFAILGLAVSLQAGSAVAQDEPSASHLEAAREVVTGSGMGRTFNEMVTMARRSVREQMPSTPQMTEMLDEILEDMEEEMLLQRRAMLNRAARIMARRLTEDELTEIAAFFNSPAGQRYVELQPLFLDDIFTAMDDWSEEMFEYIAVRVQVEISRREIQ